MEYRKLSELKALPKNPRTIRDEQFKILCESIQTNKEFFEGRPLILSNRTGELVVIAGNKRYDAAKYVKLRKVPTHLIEGLTEKKEREITIRDNVSNGEFDWEALGAEWGDLPLGKWGVEFPAKRKKRGEDEISVAEIETSEIHDKFWLSVTGPLPGQRNALDKLVRALKTLPGIEVQVGTTEITGEEKAWTPPA